MPAPGPKGALRPELQELPKISDRWTFLYLEHCTVSRESNALRAEDQNGYVLIPSHSFLVLMLGPGTRVSHRAMELIADSGVTVIWVGEAATKFYAGGRPLSANSALLQKQAKLVSNQRLHIQVVRKMYSMRFPGEDVEGLTLQQLRGKEGSRVRSLYKKLSEEWHVPWNGRNYKPDDFDNSDDVNKALSVANTCLYGLVHSVVAALGLAPGLGFIHVGLDKSFIYDIADLYKAEYTIPLAFELAGTGTKNIAWETRKRVRDEFYESHLIERIVKDLQWLLTDTDEDADSGNDEGTLCLWDGNRGCTEAGVQYFPRKEGKREG